MIGHILLNTYAASLIGKYGPSIALRVGLQVTNIDFSDII